VKILQHYILNMASIDILCNIPHTPPRRFHVFMHINHMIETTRVICILTIWLKPLPLMFLRAKAQLLQATDGVTYTHQVSLQHTVLCVCVCVWSGNNSEVLIRSHSGTERRSWTHMRESPVRRCICKSS
jgi:hypothetical protein